MDISQSDERRDFSTWMRTGRLPAERSGALELKFNPYHDPRNGRFTFAPGGAGYGSSGVVSYQWRSRKTRASLPPITPVQTDTWRAATPSAPISEPDQLTDAVFQPNKTKPLLQRTAGIRFPDLRSNTRPFDVPMTLEQTFPGLQNAPGGALIAAADNLLDITGPANRLTTTMSQQYADRIMSDIRAIDPNYRKDSFGFRVRSAARCATSMTSALIGPP